MFVGIDISKEKFDVCLLNVKEKYQTFPNNQAGFKKLISFVKSGKNEVHFCMEATGCYHVALAEYLHSLNKKVSVVNALLVNRFRQSMAINQKTDKSDAYVIAHFCKHFSPRLFAPKPDYIKKLEANIRTR